MVQGQQEEKGVQRVKLPDGTIQRLSGLIQQRQMLEERINEVIIVALEALGHAGKITEVDMKMGEALLEPDGPTPLNRSQRRRRP